MGDFFNPEKGVWAALSTMVDVCGLSILWLLLCIPVVTAGPASAALYYAVVKCVRPGEPGAFGAFFHSFRENFKTGALATLVCVLAAVPLACGVAIMWANHRASDAGAVLFVAYCVALVLPLGVLCWLFPLLGRFTFGVKHLFLTAFQLTVGHLPTTAAVVVLTVLAVVPSAIYWWPALFLPALAALAASLLFERVFRRYAPELANGQEESDDE